MSKAIRITGFSPVEAPGLDGHRYELAFDVGDVVNDVFMPKQSHKVPVTTSGTLQAVWMKNNSEIATSSASAAIHQVTSFASHGFASFPPISLSTSTASSTPPTDLYITPGAIVRIPEVEREPKYRSTFTLLSDDITELRDNINALANDLLGERLLELPQERPLLDVYKPVTNAQEFRTRVQSLATICIAINKGILAKELGTPDPENIGSITLLRDYLIKISDQGRSDRVCDPLKQTNNLRKGYPAHGDNVKQFMAAHDYFKLQYPVVDHELAWDTILGRYFESMKLLRALLSDARAQRAR